MSNLSPYPVCATLGETDETNINNFVTKNNGRDLTTNINLQMVPNVNDKNLWQTMENATFKTIEVKNNLFFRKIMYYFFNNFVFVLILTI